MNFQLADSEGILGVEVDGDVSSDDRFVALDGSGLGLIERPLHIGTYGESVTVKNRRSNLFPTATVKFDSWSSGLIREYFAN